VTPRPKGRAIVFGFAFWYPLAGVTWQYLHYLIGLRRLGWDVWYVEDSSRWVYDPFEGVHTPDASSNIARIAPVLEAHGFADRWAFRGAYEDGECYGMTGDAIDRLYREVDASFNVCGAQEFRDEHLATPRRVYVESDPVASQVRVANGDPEMLEILDGHDVLFTFGENLGAADCAVPVERYRWLPTRQPVVTDLWWSPPPEDGGHFTTISTWANKGTVEIAGETYYWSKDREFLRVIDLPSRRPGTEVEVALGGGPDAHAALNENGWKTRSSLDVSADVGTYRSYVQQSRGELTVAKDQYARLRTGWFSDRSATYLAAGRPVITQDTAFGEIIPTGDGLFAFDDVDGMATALDAVDSDYEHHCAAATELARTYFEAETVLSSLLDRAGLG
jgi:hypothetical protein